MIRPGEVYMADFAEAGPHPVIILSREELNRGRHALVAVCTSARFAIRSWLRPVAAVKRTRANPRVRRAQDRIDHFDRHGVTPEEVEEARFGHALVQRAKSEGENPVYYVLGQSDAGRGVGDSELLREWGLDRLHAT